MIILKPCPFCGGVAKLEKERRADPPVSYGVTFARCQSCLCRTHEYVNDGYYNMKTSDEEVAEIWNRSFHQ